MVSAFPTRSFKFLYHVGTMNVADKKAQSHEGAGLSVSLHPDEWRKIARGHVSGTTFKLIKQGNQFLDVHKLNLRQRTTILDWGVAERLIEMKVLYRVEYYDDEMESNVYSDYPTKELADREGESKPIRGQPVATERLNQLMGMKVELAFVFDMTASAYADRVLHLDGCWWADQLDVSRYSAPRGVIFPDRVGEWSASLAEKIEQTPLNIRNLREEPIMSLRAKIAESETEYRYKVFSTANLHEPTAIAQIRIGLAGRMARDIEPVGILPYSGTKVDRFPEVAMKPTYVVELVTGLPLKLNTAVRELSMALNVAQDLIQIDGEDIEVEKPKTEKPYDKDGVTPGFLSRDENHEKVHMVVALKDLMGDLSSGKGEKNPTREVKPVYEGFSITQIEAEMLLGEDLRRGYYVVRGLDENRIGISGPHSEVPCNYPLDLDRVRDLQVESLNGQTRMDSLIEFDVSLAGRLVLKEMNYSSTKLSTVRVQDTDTGREYPILVTVRPGMGDDEIRNAAVQEVSRKYQISTDRLIALDPNRAAPQMGGARQVAA